MNRFIPNFLSSSGEENQAEEPSVMSDESRVTRSRAANLQIPGPNSIAARARAASRSPSPAAAGRQFFEDMATSNPAPDVEELRRIATEAIQALALATANQPRPKRPELPAFDKANIEIWIKRVEAAYERAGVTTAKEKFAFLESKFEVSQNPKINTFLYGAATNESWQAFLKYLRDEYGETPRQEAAFLLQPLQRNGLRPSQLLASLNEKTRKVTIDDIRKEKIITALPFDIQRAIIDKVETLSADETATLADRFFDKEGKPLQPPSSAMVNHIAAPPEGLVDTEDEEETVNAIPHQRNQQHGKKPGFDRQKPRQKPARSFAPKVSSKPLCWKHERWGSKATTCEPGCSLYQGEQAKEKAGRRM